MAGYEYIRAEVDCGHLVFKYKVKGGDKSSSMAHDEDVSEWSEEDVREVTKMMLDAEDDDIVEVIWM